MAEQSASSALHFKSISLSGTRPGPRLIVLGAVHGNETCGTQAIARVLDDIDSGRLAVVGGSVTLVPIANPLAYLRRERAGDRNLNRNLRPVPDPRDFEDHVANWLCPLLARHEVLLDLHSTRARNPPFAMLGSEYGTGSSPRFIHHEKERALALSLGVRRFVDGWLSAYAKGVERRRRPAGAAGGDSHSPNADLRYGVGTTEYMRSVGGYAITLECGGHDDPSSPGVGYRAILNALSHLGISAAAPSAPVTEYEALRMVEIHDRNHAGDAFSRAWASFDALHQGDLIGTRHDGTQLVAEEEGCILFPDAQAKPGNEWFTLARTLPAI